MAEFTTNFGLTFLTFNLKPAMKKLALGVDIGGINTAFGLVDENGDLYAESVISTRNIRMWTIIRLYCGTCATPCMPWPEPFVRLRTDGHRHRRAQRQLPQGNGRDARQPVEIPGRRPQSRREPPHLPAGERHFELFRRREDAHHERRQCGDDRRDDLR